MRLFSRDAHVLAFGLIDHQFPLGAPVREAVQFLLQQLLCWAFIAAQETRLGPQKRIVCVRREGDAVGVRDPEVVGEHDVEDRGEA